MSSRLWIFTGLILVVVALGGAIYVSQRGSEASTIQSGEFPVAINDGDVLTQKNNTVKINVLGNDYTKTETALTISESPKNGSVVIGTDKTNSYTPKDNFTGEDNYSYQLCNGSKCDTATVNIVISEKKQLHTSSGGGKLSGTSFYDLNENTQFDNNEPGLSGWGVYLDLNNNGLLDDEEPTKETSSSGAFTFTNLANGTYVLRQISNTNWTQTIPTTGIYSRTIESNDSITDLNFGNVNTQNPKKDSNLN